MSYIGLNIRNSFELFESVLVILIRLKLLLLQKYHVQLCDDTRLHLIEIINISYRCVIPCFKLVCCKISAILGVTVRRKEVLGVAAVKVITSVRDICKIQEILQVSVVGQI